MGLFLGRGVDVYDSGYARLRWQSCIYEGKIVSGNISGSF